MPARPVRVLLCALAALLLGPREALGVEWEEARKAFEQRFVVGGKDPAERERLRAGKRDALIALRESGDARAVPLLLEAHRRQGRFVEDLFEEWTRRREPHLKLAPAMERALQARSAQAQGGTIQVTQAEKAWLDEKAALEALRGDIAQEEEIGEAIRKATARVLRGLAGPAHDQALKALIKAVGKAQAPAERDFIRLLGYLPGEAVTQALLGFVRDLNPLVTMAALEALGRQNDPRTVDVLIERLADPRWQVRAAALEGLAFRREARVVCALLEHGAREDGVLRRHYLTALARIAGQGVEALPPTLEAWVTWWATNEAAVVAAWEQTAVQGPVEEDLPAIPLGGGGGATSFYGIQTHSKHIVFVVDVSGSMGEQGGVDAQGRMRIDVVKAELANAIRALSADDTDERGPSSFNIVTYAAEVGVFREGKMVPATKANKDKAFQWIEGLTALGATNIFDALEQAFAIVDTRRMAKQLAQGADTIFLMTDGEPNRGKIVDPDQIRAEVRKLNRDRKITIHAIGVGKDHNRAFLERLAVENHGQYLGR